MYIYQLATGILQEEPVETYNRGPPIAFASSGGLPKILGYHTLSTVVIHQTLRLPQVQLFQRNWSW